MDVTVDFHQRKLLLIAPKPRNSQKFSPSKVSRYTVHEVQEVTLYLYVCGTTAYHPQTKLMVLMSGLIKPSKMPLQNIHKNAEMNGM